MTALIIFFVFSLVNVILQTLKSIWTAKLTNKFIVSSINAIAFAFYTVVLKQLTGYDMVTSVIVMIITNLIGVYISMIIVEKARKDKLWKIEVTFKTEFVKLNISYTDAWNIPHSVIDLGEYTLVNFYCSTQEQSKTIHDCIKRYEGKYFVSESKSL